MSGQHQTTRDLPSPAEASLRDPAELEAIERDADRLGDAALSGRGLTSSRPRPRQPSGEGFAGLGQGQRMPTQLGRRLSTGLGLDLSDLRLHDSAEAQEIADGMGAEAAISGRDVVLGQGAPAPDRPEGEALLAHEAAHHAQAANQPGLPTVLRQDSEAEASSGVGVSPPEAAFEVGTGRGPEDDRVLFEFDSADLSPSARASLRAIVAGLTGAVDIDLYGYASTEGSDGYNRNLSAHRAVTVQRLLGPLLPTGSEIVVHAHGEVDAFGPPARNRRVGIDVTDRAETTATPAQVPGLPQPSPIPPVSLGVAGQTLGPAEGPQLVPEPEIPSPDAEASIGPPPPVLPRRFRLPLSDPLTLDPDLAQNIFNVPRSLGTPSTDRLDYLPLARLAHARGLSLISLADRGELESAYALHRQLYPGIPQSADDVDNWLLSKIVGAMTAQAATERALGAQLSREHPGLQEDMERMGQIDRVMRGADEPFVIPPITIFELEFDISLGVLRIP